MNRIRQVLIEGTVSSSKGDKEYHVTFSLGFVDHQYAKYKWRCTCPDYVYRENTCKHIRGFCYDIGTEPVDSEPFVYDDVIPPFLLSVGNKQIEVTTEESDRTPFIHAVFWANAQSVVDYLNQEQIKKLNDYGLYTTNPLPDYTIYSKVLCESCGKNNCKFPLTFGKTDHDDLHIHMCNNRDCDLYYYNLQTISQLRGDHGQNNSSFRSWMG